MMYLARYGEAAVFDGWKLRSQSTGQFQSNPTLAAGDVKVQKDGGSLTNLATLPTLSPAASTEVHVELSASELTCRIATINFIDASGAEWDDTSFQVYTYGHPLAYFPFDFGSATVTLSNAQMDQLEDKIWDAQLSDHTVLGSFGEGLRLSEAEREDLTDHLLDQADTIEVGLALRGAMRLIAAAAAGVQSGGGTNTVIFRNAVANTKDRITATVSEAENRISVTTDLTD